MITNGFTYIAVLVFLAAVLVTLEKTSKGVAAKFFKFIPAVVLCYLLAMLLCTLNVWDMAETKPAYSALKNNLTYAMIFAMLLRCDIRKVIKLGPKMLIGVLSATLTIVIGFIGAFLIMKGVIGNDAWMGLGALCGSWIGGSGNMVAVQTALNISEADMGYALVIDSIDYSLWVMFLLWAIQLAPKFKLEVGAADKVDYYHIDVTDEMVENQVKMYTQRNGKYEKADSYEPNDMMKGILAELDENGSVKEGGIQVEDAVMMPEYMKNDDQKARFNGAKVNDVIIFNPATAWDNNQAELASLLKIEKEAAAEVKADFSYQVTEITRFVAGDLNQEIFDQVFGKDVVSSEEEFRSKVKEGIQAQFAQDSDFKFLIDFRKVMMEKVGKLEYPEALLKRIMLQNNADKGEQFVEENFAKSLEELTWHLIKEQLVENYGIKVENEDVTAMAKAATRAQFAQYGMMNVPDNLLDNYAKEMLKKKESVDGLVNRAVEAKLVAAVKPQVTLEEKTVSIEDFNKMFE